MRETKHRPRVAVGWPCKANTSSGGGAGDQPGAGYGPDVNCPDCGRRMPVNNIEGRTDVYCRHCDLEFPVSSEGAPKVRRTVKRVERDEDRRISFVDEQLIG